MAGGWGSAKSGFRLGVFWTGTETRSGGSEGRLTGGTVRLRRAYNTVDTTNSLSVSGSAVVNDSWSNRNLSGNGDMTIVSVVGEWRPLSYGSTTTAYFTADLSGLDVVSGGTLTVTEAVTLPARPYDAPDPQTGVTVTRVSDTQQTVSWTRHASTGAPYSKQYLYRKLSGESWTAAKRIATMAGSVTSYADKSTVANARYDYRLQAYNSAGYSSYSSSASIYTSPAAPVNASISKSGTTITINWVDQSAFETGFEVQESTTGPLGTYSPLATKGAGVTTHVHTGASNVVTHTYRIRAVAGSLSSGWLVTQTVSLLAKPNPPLVTVPDVLDLDVDDLELAFVHQSVDTTAQTAAEVRYRAVGDVSWTTVALTTQTSTTIPAGTLPNGVTYEVQARTKGGHADWSDWSTSSLVKGSAAPQVTIEYPEDGGTVGDSTATISWSYFQADGVPQAAWEAELHDADNWLETKTGIGDATTDTFDSTLRDGESYTYRLRVQSGDGAWSEWAEVTSTVDFLPPPTPEVDATFDADNGSVELSITVPGPEDGTEVAAVTISVRRRDIARTMPEMIRPTSQAVSRGQWVTILTEIPVPEDGSVSVVDRIPPLVADVEYQAVTVSATPSTAVADVTVDCSGGCWLYVNAGPGWESQAKVWANLSPSYTPDPGKEVVTFYGGATEEFYEPTAVVRTYQFSGDVATWPTDEGRIGAADPWEVLSLMPAPVCLRDPRGRRMFGSLSAVPQSYGSMHTGVSGTLTETSFSE